MRRRKKKRRRIGKTKSKREKKKVGKRGKKEKSERDSRERGRENDIEFTEPIKGEETLVCSSALNPAEPENGIFSLIGGGISKWFIG